MSAPLPDLDDVDDLVVAGPVLAADSWSTNAELIADVARLGYLRREWLTLDPTYGGGLWWTDWSPEVLVTHDLALDGIDFRELPEADDTFDAVAYDPPYVSVGGRDTTGMPDFYARYGLTDAPRTPLELQQLINDGLAEVARVLKPRGFALVKCQDYISSGKFWNGTFRTQVAAFALGFTQVDRFEMIGAIRPQPPGRRQVHRNLSTLLVFRAPP